MVSFTTSLLSRIRDPPECHRALLFNLLCPLLAIFCSTFALISDRWVIVQIDNSVLHIVVSETNDDSVGRPSPSVTSWSLTSSSLTSIDSSVTPLKGTHNGTTPLNSGNVFDDDAGEIDDLLLRESNIPSGELLEMYVGLYSSGLVRSRNILPISIVTSISSDGALAALISLLAGEISLIAGLILALVGSIQRPTLLATSAFIYATSGLAQLLCMFIYAMIISDQFSSIAGGDAQSSVSSGTASHQYSIIGYNYDIGFKAAAISFLLTNIIAVLALVSHRGDVATITTRIILYNTNKSQQTITA